MSRTPVPDTWPTDPPILGTVPSDWSRDAAGFVALLSQHRAMWLEDSNLKYLSLHIDTRDGGFVLRDRDGSRVSVAHVLEAIRRAQARFGDSPWSSDPMTAPTPPEPTRTEGA